MTDKEINENYMEMEFHKIELEDKEQIERYLQKKIYRSCDLVFPNIYLLE